MRLRITGLRLRAREGLVICVNVVVRVFVILHTFSKKYFLKYFFPIFFVILFPKKYKYKNDCNYR